MKRPSQSYCVAGLFPFANSATTKLAAAGLWRRARRLVPLLAAGMLAIPASAQSLFILTTDGRLATTSTANPAANSTPVTIANVTAGETLVAIDVRPQNQKLYALGVNATADTATLYQISPETGFAGVVGTAAAVTFTTDGVTVVDLPDPATVPWDIDFNPAVDRVRVVAGSLNFRINPNTGAPVDGDNGGAAGSVTGVNRDGAINGGTTTVNATAYTNSQPNNGSVTTQYTLDASANSLFIQNPPNAGTQTQGQTVTLGGAPLDFAAVSLDIAPGVNAAASNSPVVAGSALMVATVGGTTGLYSLNLVTAQATLFGNLSLAVRSSAIRTELGAAIALAANGTSLMRFDPARPPTTTTQAINTAALVAGETLVGIDGRPQTGQLYGLAVNGTANTATLYLIDPQTGAPTAVGAQSAIAFVDAAGAPVDLPDPATVGYGIDFNPTVDRVRVIAGNGLNFRLNPNTGAPVDGDLGGAAGSVAGSNPDAPQNGLPGGSIGATSAAYTNNFAQPLTGGVTTLYTLDAPSSRLYIQNPPNAGTQTASVPVTINGATPLFFSGGFDIPSPVAATTSHAAAVGEGWLLVNVGIPLGVHVPVVYRLDLSTGAATAIDLFGDGAVLISGLVVWATVPEIAVESPVGTEIQDNTSTINFGATIAGTPVTRTIRVKNLGSQALTYSTAFSNVPVGFSFGVTENPTGTIAGSGSATLTVSFNASTAGPATATLRILSNDADEISFDIALTGTATAAITALTDDAVTASTGTTRLYPLANDDFAGTLASVSNPAILISGRALIIPQGFGGTFTYTVTNGPLSGQATVTVSTAPAVVNPTRFSGLLTDAMGEVVGIANVTISQTGAGSLRARVNQGAGVGTFSIPTGGTTANVSTALGTFTLVRNLNGTVSATLATTTGTLQALRVPAIPQRFHIALASIDAAIPGGGFLIADVKATGDVIIAGRLPDGRPVSTSSALRDNRTLAFYSLETSGVNPRGTFGGELIPANLTTTDITGELVWAKPAQNPGALGTHRGGVETILTANGSLYAGVVALNGAGTLAVSGGNLAVDESRAVTVTTGRPAPLTGSLKVWTGISHRFGTFTASVLRPGTTAPVGGSGIYLPKSNRAWGYFPGATAGGRIELSVP